MCAPTNNNTSHYPDDHDEQGIMKWKLKERLLESEGEFSMAIEVKTWDGAPPYYGSIEIYWVETHIDARAFYQYGNYSIDFNVFCLLCYFYFVSN